MRRRAAWIGPPVLLGTVWLLSFFTPLLSPGRVLANRDIPLFHLPLRASFRLLVESGSPLWSPWLNGGQPVLSNPSYAAFYPPGWLVFVVPPAYALSLLVVLHSAVAFAGAWWLARRLGADRGTAALAALGYTGSGASLSLISALTLFCSMAWFPWVIGHADAALRAKPGAWLRPALLAGLALALQLLNGEPATVVITGLGVLAVAVAGAPRHARSLPRILVPLTLALLLAAVQWLPTWGRLAGSPRAGGLEARRATVWSAPPARLLELAYPRFFGDPARDHEKLFFGWNLHDRDYPYVPSIYPGLLLTVLAVAGLAQWPLPRRAAWIFAFAVGAFLALGRHNPLYEPLREAVPVLAVLRFPEKFAILAVAAVVFAGALGWGWLIRERGEGRPERADFPLALSLVLLALAGALTGLLYRVPRLAEWFVRTHGGPGMTPERIQHGILYLRGEGWAALATAALVAALLALCRWRRPPAPPARLLTGLALALLAADLWHYGHGLVQVAPASLYGLHGEPPPVAVRPETRLYVQETSGGEPDFVPRRGDLSLAPVRASIDRMEPYSALLWRIPYALNEDFDLMLTRWASRAVDILHQEWGSRASQNALRYLGAWNVGTLMLRKDPADWMAEAERNPRAPLMRVLENPYVLPRHRFVPRAVFHPDADSALAAARAEGYELMRREHAVRPGRAAGETVYPRLPEPLELADRGGGLRMRYRSASPAFFVVAATFDPGWRAEVDGAPVPVLATAACQIGLELPGGEHLLELRYRDPLVPAGAGITLLALAATVLLLIRDRRRQEHLEPGGG